MIQKPNTLKSSRRLFLLGGGATTLALASTPAHAEGWFSRKSKRMKNTAMQFFEACETGKGWEVCKEFCHADASFASQTDALAGIDTLEAYTNWMTGLLTILEDGSYDVKSFAVDSKRGAVTAFAVFKGTHTGEGGPVPPTGKSATADYVYNIEFEDGLIRHMTKIWNDAQTMKQLGWA